MSSIEKNTVTVRTGVAIFVSVITVAGGIYGNFWATRMAVAIEMNQVRNDIRFEIMERKNADDRLEDRITANKLTIERLEQSCKPSTITTFHE